MNTEKKKLLVDGVDDLWDEMPDNIKADLNAALIESKKGEVVPHAEIQKR